jgi:hypothetical protein
MACQDYVVLDRYIACSTTKWAGYLLVSQVEVADGCAIFVANAPHQIMRLRPQWHGQRLRTAALDNVFAPEISRRPQRVSMR